MNHKKIIRYLLLLIFTIGMLVSILIYLSWNKENNKTEEIVKEEKIRLIEKENEILLEKEILKDNPDTIGWLIVEGTEINYPVVRYKNNDYYLNHDFKKDYSSAGWIFMDYKNELEDQNLVIYGHHRHDGSMFGSIDHLLNPQEKELEIKLITFDKVEKYKIFSIYKINKEDPYTNRSFNNLKEEIIKFQKRSLVDFDQEIETPSQLITLSTCHQNNIDRIVVHGYKK